MDTIVSPRNHALLAASVLALMSAAPAPVLAAEPDHEHEGSLAPEQAATGDARSAPDFDTGGPPTELRFDDGPGPEEADQAVDVTGDANSPAQEPATDESVPVAGTDRSGTEGVGEQAEPPASEPLQSPPAAEPVAPEPAPSALPQEAPAATQDEQQVASPQPVRTHQPVRDTGAASRPEVKKPHTANPGSPVMVPALTQPAAASQPQPAVARGVSSSWTTVRRSKGTATHRRAVHRTDAFHVVRANESLWSIARDLLGDDASPARIAREVNRLWELNSRRIGTGDPDLLPAGTRLKLR